MLSIKPRRTEVVLFQGGDYDHIETLALEVEAAAQVVASRSARLGDDDETDVRTKASEYDAAVAEAAERGLTVVVVALPRKQYRGLINEHPPREDNEQDRSWGFNYETLADPLVPASVPLVDPETEAVQFASEGDRQSFLDELSDGDFSRLYSAAIKVNQGGGINPKVSLSSRLGPTSSESSERPARLG